MPLGAGGQEDCHFTVTLGCDQWNLRKTCGALRQEGHVYRVRFVRMRPSVRRVMSSFHDSYNQLGYRGWTS